MDVLLEKCMSGDLKVMRFNFEIMVFTNKPNPVSVFCCVGRKPSKSSAARSRGVGHRLHTYGYPGSDKWKNHTFSLAARIQDDQQEWLRRLQIARYVVESGLGKSSKTAYSRKHALKALGMLIGICLLTFDSTIIDHLK